MRHLCSIAPRGGGNKTAGFSAVGLPATGFSVANFESQAESGRLPPSSLEARLESIDILSNCHDSAAALCRGTHLGFSPEQSGLGSGRGSWLNEVRSF